MKETNPSEASRLALRTHKPKGKKSKIQLSQVVEGLFQAPLTMKMLSIAIDVDRANICRYVRTLRKAGRIAIVRKGLCAITKHRAYYLTTNPDLFPAIKQTKLFS